MGSPPESNVTHLLRELDGNDRQLLDRLFALVYDELLAAARQERGRWKGDYTLNTTGLVHELYLKLSDRAEGGWTSRAHFLASAAKAMRNLLVDYARRRRSRKRGGDLVRVSLEDSMIWGNNGPAADPESDLILALEEALTRLERQSERRSRVVECRVFGGMSVEEAAEALGISQSTIKRDWALAQAWLHRELQKGSD